MAIYHEDLVTIDLESGSVFRSYAGKIVGEADNSGNRYGIIAKRKGEDVELSGAAVTGYFIRADKTTVIINGGTVGSGNKAYVTLPQACYAKIGAFALAIKLTIDGVTSTVRIVDGTVVETTTDTVIDPGTVIPDISDLLAMIDEMEAAVEAANAAAAQVINTLKSGDFEKGSINEGQDDTFHASSRCRTPIIKAIDSFSITPLDGASFFVDYMDVEGNFLYSSAWRTGTYTIQRGSICRVCLAYTREDTETRTIGEIMARFIIGQNDADDISDYEDLERLFEYGSLENGRNDSYRSGVRARTRGVCTSKNNIMVRWNHGAFGVSYFASDGTTYKGSSGWLTTDYMIPAGTIWRIVVDADPSAGNDTTYPMDYIQGSIDLEQKKRFQYSANPNIIWACRHIDDAKYPPHSKIAIMLAAENQYDRIKCCCRKTTDGYFVAVHDTTINNLARNTDGTAISTTINTDDCTLAELNQYDWGIKYGSDYAGMNVPMVADVMKYAAMYGMGLNLEFYFYPTNAEIDALMVLIEKYGLAENTAICTANYMDFTSMQYWKSKSERLSYYISGTYSNVAAQAANINALKTGRNEIWCEPLPWQTLPDAEFRHLAVSNGWRLFIGFPMSYSELLSTVGIDHGGTQISVGNVYMIKDTIRKWANRQS